MNIVVGNPPNFETIKKAFKLNDYVVFTYGDTLYNPGGGEISNDLLEHERVHSQQQGDHPDIWWDKYMKSDEFRLAQEVIAYRKQYNVFKKTHKDRNAIARFVHRIARDLSGDIYGKIITYSDAEELITQ